MSDTPKTDSKAQFFGFNPDEGEEFVQADFARELERENAALLEALEDMARRDCHTGTALRDYNGQVAGTMVTDSGAITVHAIALRRLADADRFRIVAESRRMVVGYWPENDPQKKERAAIDAARKEQP